MKIRFKTNINCSNCVARVTPLLDEKTGIEKWEVDTTDPKKVLTVEATGLTPQDVIDTVKKAGFMIEQVDAGN